MGRWRDIQVGCRWFERGRIDLDQWLFRQPFTGTSAERYTRAERTGFDDLDTRLLQRWQTRLARAHTLLDVGAGPGVFGRRVARAHPHLTVFALEPSHSFLPCEPDVTTVRARAEALPLADRCIDVAVCLSSLRHVADRAAGLRELRRVVHPGGMVYIVDFDPRASRRRIAHHRRHMGRGLLRTLLGPLVVRTAPSIDQMTSLARACGFDQVVVASDERQPVYILSLS